MSLFLQRLPESLNVLLVQRKHWPHTGKWAIPGGFVEIDESLKRAAWRELREETGVQAGFLEQLGAFGRGPTAILASG